MEATAAVIELESVKKRFGAVQALDGVTFTVERGDVFGYLGANGAGKTTTIRILLDLLRADSGRVSVLGNPTDRVETRRKIGFMLDADGLYDQLTAVENLQFYAKLYGCSPSAGEITALLASVRLSERANDRAGTYSKGMRRRLALARALVHDPEVLILDEPISGIDPTGQIEIRAIIQDLVHERGKTILLSSHDLDEIERLCNRIALIDQGEIRVTGDLKQLLGAGGEGRVTIATSTPVAPAILAEIRGRFGVEAGGGGSTTLDLKLPVGVRNADVVSFLTSRGVGVEGVATKHTSLEELYAAILKEREA
ncbi:MAG: ABC transporter ATP-binding protein [Candidatus Bipolaricaulota bacterium]|nr:ABC transporter ATP-binding protein [Candidatus Bipolaricaulota bacterium]